MIEVHIPLEIPSQNDTERGRNHYGRAAKTRTRRNAWACCTRSEMHRLGVPPASGIRSIHIIAYRKRLCLDTANLIGGAKSCVDGIADAGLVINDRDSKARITYEQRLSSKSPTKKPHTVLQVSEQ